MTKEYEETFDGQMYYLNGAIYNNDEHAVRQQLVCLLLTLHEQNQKLEARIAELERMHSFNNNISVANDLSKRAAKAEFTREHDNLPVSTGYVPDDLRQS